MAKPKLLEENRYAFRYPTNPKAREELSGLRWIVFNQLCAEGLPVPKTGEELEALTARWLELFTVVANTYVAQQDPDRVGAFMREFLHLACPPESPLAPPESTESMEENSPEDVPAV